MSDAARMERYEQRHAVPRPMTARDVADLYERGGSLPDAEIRRIRESNPAAWEAAVDPDYRKQLLRPPGKQTAVDTAPVVVRAMPRDAVNISQSLARLERIMAAPVVPVKNDRGEIVILAELLEDADLDEGQRTKVEEPLVELLDRLLVSLDIASWELDRGTAATVAEFVLTRMWPPMLISTACAMLDKHTAVRLQNAAATRERMRRVPA